MAWLEVHQSLLTHRKTLTVAETLNIRPVQVLGHVVSLWLWSLDSAPDGDLTGVPARVLARAVQWDDEPELLLAALLSAGFLDQEGDCLRIHDWWDYAGKLIDQRRANAERQKRFRQKSNAHVTVTSPLGNGSQYSTVQNTTVPGSLANADASARATSLPTPEPNTNGRAKTTTPRKATPGLEPAERRVRTPPASAEQFDALVDALGYDRRAVKQSRSLSGCVNKAAADLLGGGFDRDDILFVAEELRTKWPGKTFSAMAIAKWAPTYVRG